MGKFFKEDVQLTLMRKIDKYVSDVSASGRDECCSIAESMIDEIQQIAMPNRMAVSSESVKHMDSLKRKVIQQIRHARRIAMAD